MIGPRPGKRKLVFSVSTHYSSCRYCVSHLGGFSYSGGIGSRTMKARRFVRHYSGTDSHHSGPSPHHASDRHRHEDLSRDLAEARLSAEGRGPQVYGPGYRLERLPQRPEVVEAAAGIEQLRGDQGMARAARAQLVHGSRSAAFGPDPLGPPSPRSPKAWEANGTKPTFARAGSNEVRPRNLVLDPLPVSGSLCQVASHRSATGAPVRS